MESSLNPTRVADYYDFIRMRGEYDKKRNKLSMELDKIINDINIIEDSIMYLVVDNESKKHEIDRDNHEFKTGCNILMNERIDMNKQKKIHDNLFFLSSLIKNKKEKIKENNDNIQKLEGDKSLLIVGKNILSKELEEVERQYNLVSIDLDLYYEENLQW